MRDPEGSTPQRLEVTRAWGTGHRELWGWRFSLGRQESSGDDGSDVA